MKKSLKITSGGLGFFSTLTLIFVVLKLTNLISWSWWLVFSPLLISFGISVLCLIIFLLIFAKKRRRRR